MFLGSVQKMKCTVELPPPTHTHTYSHHSPRGQVEANVAQGFNWQHVDLNPESRSPLISVC